MLSSLPFGSSDNNNPPDYCAVEKSNGRSSESYWIPVKNVTSSSWFHEISWDYDIVE